MPLNKPITATEAIAIAMMLKTASSGDCGTQLSQPITAMDTATVVEPQNDPRWRRPVPLCQGTRKTDDRSRTIHQQAQPSSKPTHIYKHPAAMFSWATPHTTVRYSWNMKCWQPCAQTVNAYRAATDSVRSDASKNRNNRLPLADKVGESESSWAAALTHGGWSRQNSPRSTQCWGQVAKCRHGSKRGDSKRKTEKAAYRAGRKLAVGPQRRPQRNRSGLAGQAQVGKLVLQWTPYRHSNPLRWSTMERSIELHQIVAGS